MLPLGEDGGGGGGGFLLSSWRLSVKVCLVVTKSKLFSGEDVYHGRKKKMISYRLLRTYVHIITAADSFHFPFAVYEAQIKVTS